MPHTTRRSRFPRRRATLLALPASAALWAATGATALASELVYTPVNPAFGGFPSNGSWLLNSANAQQQFEEEREEKSPLEEFNERLQRSLLGRITSAVTRDIVDADGNITPGIFETIDYTITVIDEGDGVVTITTTDKLTGEQTIIQVQNDV